MAANPLNVRVVSYNPARAFKVPVGATAMRRGSLAKFASGLLVPCVADDKQLQVYVTLQEVDAASTSNVLVVPIQDCVVALAYTGTVPTPTVGVSFGIDDCITVDLTDTTNKLLTALQINTTLQIIECIGYFLPA